MNYKEILERLVQSLTAEAQAIERDMSVSQMFSQVYSALRAAAGDEWVYVDDIYRGTDGNLYAITIRDGKLWQHMINVDGSDVVVGEAVEVEVSFTEVSRSTEVRVIRTKDGKRRWYAIAATATLNRVGEIDSKALFDSFITRFYEKDQDLRLTYQPEEPYFTVLHRGTALRIGTLDYMYRSGDIYINSGLLEEDEGDENAELARAVGDLLEDEDAAEDWGISIGFYPTDEPELLRVNDSIEIPVYTEGWQVEASLLLEADAASNLTAVQVRGGNFMARDKKLEDTLLKLLGSEDAVEEFANKVEDRQRQIERNGMITREQAEEVDGTETEAVVETEVVIDDETLNAIVSQVSEQVAAQVTEQLSEMRSAFKQQLAEERQASDERIQELTQRLAKAEKPVQDRVADELADQPRRRVTHVSRPREREAEEDEVEVFSLAEIAKNTIRNAATNGKA